MRKLFIASIVVPSVVLGFMACSSSSTTPLSPEPDASPTSTSTGAKDAGASAIDASVTDSGATDSGETNDAGTQQDSSFDAGVDSSFDAGPPVINGCTTYTDNTTAGVAAPGLNWGFNINADTNHCSTIAVGQSVSWTGDFSSHPLGPHDSTGASTAGSPITSTGTSGENTVTITFPTAGTYGYWCNVHTTMMMGVIKVQ